MSTTTAELLPLVADHAPSCTCPVFWRSEPALMVDERATEQYGRPDYVDVVLSKALLHAFTEAADAHGVPLLRMSRPHWNDGNEGIDLDATIRECDAEEFRLLRSRVSSLLVRMARERADRASEI
jgi:hypothetical protein